MTLYFILNGAPYNFTNPDFARFMLYCVFLAFVDLYEDGFLDSDANVSCSAHFEG